jgi:hypothetical protein
MRSAVTGGMLRVLVDRSFANAERRVWLVSFMDYDLGYFDDETCRLEPIEDPFAPLTSRKPSSHRMTLIIERYK